MSAPWRQRRPRQITLQRWLSRLVYACIVPMLLIAAILLGELLHYTQSYRALTHNVTVASEFNQSFKANIDLVMYYYVVGSQYSTGLPVE